MAKWKPTPSFTEETSITSLHKKLPPQVLRKMRWLIAHTICDPNYPRSIEYRAILRNLDLSNEQILDVGCGSADTLKFLQAYLPSIKSIGVDVRTSALKQGLDRFPTIQFIAASAEFLPFRASSFDRILCSSALEHFKNDTAGLSEINRSLKERGIFVMTTDSVKWLSLGDWQKVHARVAFVKRYYSKTTLSREFEESRLKVVNIQFVHTSKLAAFFLKMGIKFNWKGFAWIGLSLFGIALTAMCNWAKEKEGFTLLAVCTKTL